MKFRSWVSEKWYQHLDELDRLGLPRPEYSCEYYFRCYRGWLRQQYRFEQQKSTVAVD